MTKLVIPSKVGPTVTVNPRSLVAPIVAISLFLNLFAGAYGLFRFYKDSFTKRPARLSSSTAPARPALTPRVIVPEEGPVQR